MVAGATAATSHLRAVARRIISVLGMVDGAVAAGGFSGVRASRRVREDRFLLGWAGLAGYSLDLSSSAQIRLVVIEVPVFYSKRKTYREFIRI